MLEIKLSMCLHVCMHAYVQTQVISLSSMLRIYYAKFLTEQLLSQTVMKLLITNLICIIPRNKKKLWWFSLCFLCLCPKQPSSLTCWVSKPARSHSISVPSSDSLLLLQMGQQPRGLHYKQQIKGLPLIRCQGQRGALPVLAMIQYLLICCAPG